MSFMVKYNTVQLGAIRRYLNDNLLRKKDVMNIALQTHHNPQFS